MKTQISLGTVTEDLYLYLIRYDNLHKFTSTLGEITFHA